MSSYHLKFDLHKRNSLNLSDLKTYIKISNLLPVKEVDACTNTEEVKTSYLNEHSNPGHMVTIIPFKQFQHLIKIK